MTTDYIAANSKQIEQFLTFELANEVYGVEILKVQEIRGWEAVRVIPNAPSFIKGVLNLRGSVIPIVDLRERFSLEHCDYTQKTVVIVLCVKRSHAETFVMGITVVVVLQTGNGNHTRIMGVVVDSVSDVISVDKSEIQGAPDFGTKVSNEFINGLVSVNERMVMLLDVDKLLTLETTEQSEN